MMSAEDEMRLICENRLEQQLKEGLEKGIEQTMARVMKADSEPVYAAYSESRNRL